MKHTLLLALILCSTGAIERANSYEVYVFLHDECIISRYYTIPLSALSQEYKDVADFIGVFPNADIKEERLTAFKQKYKIPFKLMSDADFKLVDELNATITPEVFVREVATGRTIYAGRIDNAYARIGKKRTIVTSHELKEVLTALRNHNTPIVQNQPAIGCLITNTKN